MSKSQKHGVLIERALSLALTGVNIPRKPNALWDIPAAYDLQHGLHTSVKAAKNNEQGNALICLADLRRLFSITQPFRWLFATFDQVGDLKRVDRVFELFPTAAELKKLRGLLTLSQVTEFHELIRAVPRGAHEEGRQWAQKYKAKLMQLAPTIYILNPKLGNKDNARRLQGSAWLDTLLKHIKKVIVHTNHFYGAPLPIIKSPAREVSKNDDTTTFKLKGGPLTMLKGNQSFGDGWPRTHGQPVALG